jgi:hypothetical protein
VDLDLTGQVVLTEAATGAYAVTPVIAAAAGAQVHALARDSRYGTADEATATTLDLADELGVRDQIAITKERDLDLFGLADIVTNSGHLRPIDATVAGRMQPGAAVPLMFEAWELGAGRVDLDLDALRASGVQVAGTNERHPELDVFGYLGPLAVAQLADAGVPARHNRVAVLCDNPFLESLVDGLGAAGADVVSGATLDELLPVRDVAALVVAQRPRSEPVLTPSELHRMSGTWPGLVITQLWGDLDRAAGAAAGLTIWPDKAPATGHMGVLLSRLGPDPIVRLQTGGLKVGQVLRTPEALRTLDDLEYLDEC